MSAALSSPSTWEYRSGNDWCSTQLLFGAARPLRDRMAAFFSTVAELFRTAAFRNIALGNSDVAAVRHWNLQLAKLKAAMQEAASDAAQAAELGEADPPNLDAWWEACQLIMPIVHQVPTPEMTPMQRGVLSVEWQVEGLGIELRFRGASDLFTVIEDVTGDLEFMGRDHGYKRATAALRSLASRAA